MAITESMVPERDYQLLKKANKLLKDAYENLEKVNEILQSQVDSLKRDLECEKDLSRGFNKQRINREAAVKTFLRDIEDFAPDSATLKDIALEFEEKYFRLDSI